MHLEQEQVRGPSTLPFTTTTTTTAATTTTTDNRPQPTHHHQHHHQQRQSHKQSTTTAPAAPSATARPKPQPQHLYFAYGSNLSPSQMRLRCTHNPSRSAHPVALAYLDNWRWLIGEAGYANVVPPPDLRVGNQIVCGDAVCEALPVPEAGGGEGVFGVLYEMSEEDERVLDGYEGVRVGCYQKCSSLVGGLVDVVVSADEEQEQEEEEEAGGLGRVPVSIRPREQAGDYNKWYVRARVVKWLDEGYRDANGLEGEGGEVRVLVYVDEQRVKLGKPKDEYVPRMNRAIKEAVELGFPADWAERVIRSFIPLV
ncbi:hypothetical protein BJX61DRAFT_471767 [Aspergillus egyptiacus]|nr:hypothetical protein BJX61DRAFT_471767 [Aspergillus egyptiacus]